MCESICSFRKQKVTTRATNSNSFFLAGSLELIWAKMTVIQANSLKGYQSNLTPWPAPHYTDIP